MNYHISIFWSSGGFGVSLDKPAGILQAFRGSDPLDKVQILLSEDIEARVHVSLYGIGRQARNPVLTVEKLRLCKNLRCAAARPPSQASPVRAPIYDLGAVVDRRLSFEHKRAPAKRIKERLYFLPQILQFRL